MKVGDLVMLNKYFMDHGRLAIITKTTQWNDVYITFTDTLEETQTYRTSLELVNATN
jgi:hypothetical protein|tara:strand:- start:1968 stop:2138 length:171 start_codon:yes stop_codon:yes gene_type:complete